MVRFYRIAAVVASILLIIWDINTIIDILGNAQATENSADFAANTAFILMVPCNLFLGISVLLHISGKKAAKPLFITTMIITAIHFIIRVIVIVWYLVEMSNGNTIDDSIEYFNFAQFIGFALLLATIFLFSLYSIKNIFKKTTTVLFALAAVTLIVTWIMVVSSDLSVFGAVGFGNLDEFLSMSNAGDIIALAVGLLGYAIIFIWGLKIAE